MWIKLLLIKIIHIKNNLDYKKNKLQTEVKYSNFGEFKRSDFIG